MSHYMVTDQDKAFMRRAVELSARSLDRNEGGPFGAVVVRDNQIIAEGCNQVLLNNDPTAHAEVLAIRQASQVINSAHLRGCRLYTSCEPCPMCLGAIYWAQIEAVFYTNTQIDAMSIGFDDSHIYQELNRSYADRQVAFRQVPDAMALEVFELWKQQGGQPY